MLEAVGWRMWLHCIYCYIRCLHQKHWFQKTPQPNAHSLQSAEYAVVVNTPKRLRSMKTTWFCACELGKHNICDLGQLFGSVKWLPWPWARHSSKRHVWAHALAGHSRGVAAGTCSSLGRMEFFRMALIRSLSSAYSYAIFLLLTSRSILQST